MRMTFVTIGEYIFEARFTDDEKGIVLRDVRLYASKVNILPIMNQYTHQKIVDQLIEDKFAA